MDGQIRFILIFAVVTSAAQAQQSTYLLPSGGAQTSAHRYSVTGDVEKPQTYQFDSSAQVHVLDLVSTAGIIEPGNAVILRGMPLTAVSAENVDPRNPYRGALLTPGDVVVFRSASGLIPGQPNACVLIGKSRAVLPLPDGYRSVSGLLRQCGLPEDQTMAVTRSGWASVSPVQLNGSESIQHGDIVDLSWVQTSQQHVGQLFEIPPAEFADINSATAMAATETTSAVVPENELSQTVSDVAPDLMVPTDSPEATDLSDEASGPFRNASLQRVLDDSPAAPPSVAAIDGSAVHADPAGSAVMNTIFIAGLLFAMGLILVGWIRTKREQEVAAQVPLGLASTEIAGVKDVVQSGNQTVATAASESATVDSDDELQSATLVDADAWYSPETATEPTAEVPDNLSIHSCDEQTAGENVVAEPGAAAWSDLEDLIQNRLPVELKQSALPLNVAVYGRPNGPQRMRIDAAHSEIAEPHMAKRSRMNIGRSRAEAVTGKTKSTQSSVHNERARDISKLDQALNYVEELSDT